MSPIEVAMDAALRQAGFPIPSEADTERLLSALKDLGVSLTLAYRKES